MVITPENSMTIHETQVTGTLKRCDKQTDIQADGRKDIRVLRTAWSQLKIRLFTMHLSLINDIQLIYFYELSKYNKCQRDEFIIDFSIVNWSFHFSFSALC